MSRRIKLVSILFALLICFSASFAFQASAAEDEEELYSEEIDFDPEDTEYIEPEEPEYVETEPEPEEPEYVEPEDPEYEEPEYEEPEYEYVEPETEYVEPEYEYDYEDDDYETDYYDDYAQRESNVSDEKAETASVYDAEEDNVSKKTLKKSDWELITEQLKNASADASDDFDFIRANDKSGANAFAWMLPAGIAVEAIGIGLLVFFIIQNRKKVPVADGGKSNPYKDEKPKEPAKVKSSKNSSKFNTAEIELPKRASKPEKYKPKH